MHRSHALVMRGMRKAPGGAFLMEWKEGGLWRRTVRRLLPGSGKRLLGGLHAGEVVGLGHGQPALGHFGLGVALGAVHD